MIKFLKSWYKTINDIDEQNMYKVGNKRIDIFCFLLTFVLFGLPYLIIFFNSIMVFSPKTMMFHLVLWSIPLYGNVVFGLGYMFYYQVLKGIYSDNKILEQTNSKKMFYGGLINPYTFGMFILLCIFLEVFI